ncbi:MAG: hypothetical protein LBP53_04015 [Candidatus Peribacteria bacterium]|jgi:hypothetical protein|nr:hypothetical protein [Candidatus Peribacteria bacterium]
MYLEKQLLIKQVGKSKLSTQLKNGEITQQSLQNLAKKEATLLFANPQYQTFSKQLYN